MVKIIYAEDRILLYLKELSKSNVCITGLILGQSSESKDYVVHLARTPEQSDSEIQSKPASAAVFQSVKEIKESWIADHAKHVTKMLPGGMWVLGVFICSPSDIFLDTSMELKAKVILSALKKQLSAEPLLYGNSPSSEKLLLHYNINNSLYMCKTLDLDSVGSSFKTADWKFQSNYVKWCKINCNFDISQPSSGGNMFSPVKVQLKNSLKEINKSLDQALITFNKQLKNPEETLETLSKREKKNCGNEIMCLNADIFLKYKKKEQVREIMLSDCDVELQLLGVLASHVFLSHKSTVAEAISAVKHDIIRSLTARFEMHWDSLVEEEYGSPEEKLSVHEPPRRVSVLLPDSKISFNDYLFPGEGASEVVSSFQEMLDMQITETNLEELEIQGDALDFYGKSSINFSTTSSNKLLGSSTLKAQFLLIFSIIIIFVAITTSYMMQKGSEYKKQ